MISYIVKKIVGSQNDREIRRLQKYVALVNDCEEELVSLPTTELVERSHRLRRELSERVRPYAEGDEDDYYKALDEVLWELMPEAFALVREASRRTLGMRHFDVQLIGGIVLHQGKIAEMKTGEGKTLVAALPLYLNGISGLGAHLVTVNDYLARRDALWMGPIFKLLGITVGVINHEKSYRVEWENEARARDAVERGLSVWPGAVEGDLPEERDLEALAAFKTTLVECTRKEAYQADVTYGTNSEFGFDYLRDNMKFSLDEYVQREHNYAIVDEVDSILIDEARTPLIISGPSEDSTELYYLVDRHVRKLRRDVDFTVDEKTRQVTLTDEGASKIEKLLGVDNIYEPANLELLHHVHQALRAHHLFIRDVDYLVRDNQVVIVDEFTGRMMPGRRWSDGLHQAIEAKEGVKIESENQTLATITIQNYFRLYRKLAGMTGTADTESVEFKKIYDLDVVVIPTHKPMIRVDHNDLVYRTEKEKFEAVVAEIKEHHERGRPVLVGTASIENSEKLSALLTKARIKHQVLNAKHHEKEAEIIAQAGRVGAVTIATNMAGRGTDILLGGNPEYLARDILRKRFKVEPNEATQEQFEQAMEEAKRICDEEKAKVIELGGLHIIGTERHEARRIDNQLRGRSGRQGDPGSSRFYVSFEDNLMRIFASDKVTAIMDKLGWEEGVPIENRMVTRIIENAQKKVEARNFDIRKHLLEYDDVLNTQRDVVYTLRKEILSGGEWLVRSLLEWADEVVGDLVHAHQAETTDDGEPDATPLQDALFSTFGIKVELPDSFMEMSLDDRVEFVRKRIHSYYEEKEAEIGSEMMRQIERFVMLQTLDYLWKDHLLNMDHLREGIGLMGYAQKDPLYEYKKQGLEMFSAMMERFKEEVCEKLFRVQPVSEDEIERAERRRRIEQQRIVQSRGEDAEARRKVPVRRGKKIGRNEPCPCGSGKKYKKCCGRT